MHRTFSTTHVMTRVVRPLSMLFLSLLLLDKLARAVAASIYRRVDAQEHLGFEDTPCAGHARQHKIDLRRLPMIGNPADVASIRARLHAKRDRRAIRHASHRHAARRSIRKKSRMSWECRAADHEVFYRHARCTSSIPRDGVVRSDYANSMSSRYANCRHSARSRVKVHGVWIPRTAACRRIHVAGAAGRDVD